MASDTEEPSYIDYETFLAPDFAPSAFANSLVLATNNPHDAPLDLSTPLSRVLFDIQEVDSHIDLLTTRSALPLLGHTQQQNAASARIAAELDGQVRALRDSYRQLEREVVHKHAEADHVRRVAARLWDTLRLARAVGRCLQLGRQLEVQHAEFSLSTQNHRALVRCADSLVALRELLAGSAVPGSEGFGIDGVAAVRSLRAGYVEPTERSVREAAERIVREFSVGSAAGPATFAQAEEARARTVSALHALYLLSVAIAGKEADDKKWTPALMLQALEAYLRSALQSSVAGLARGLATLPTLDRALAEAAARCQNVVALEAVLEGARAPTDREKTDRDNLLRPLLARLETGSLASYFWRTLAGSLAPRVQEMVGRGGVSARVLRANRSAVGEAVRDCVAKGSQVPGKGKNVRGEGDEWEREVAVMTGSVLGPLGR